MQAALRGGQVDLITQIPVETYLAMKAANGFHAYSAVTGDHHVLYVMGNMAPFDSPKVRQAFRYLIDRKSLVASALFAQGAVGNDVTVPPGSFYLPELPQYEQDLPRAKKLLEEAGVGPITLDLFTTSERQPAPKMAIACAEAAAKIGITINVRDIPYTEYAANVARKKPMYNSFFAGSATLYDGVTASITVRAVTTTAASKPAPAPTPCWTACWPRWTPPSAVRSPSRRCGASTTTATGSSRISATMSV